MMLCFDGYAVASKEVERIFGKVLVEHWEDLWGDVIDGYLNVRR